MAASIGFRRLSLAQPRVLHRKGLEAVTVTQCRFKSAKKQKKETHMKKDTPKVSEKFLQKRPLHTVYMLKDFPQQYFSFEECASMHKEAAHPWMLDSLDKRLYADLKLDLSTKKQTKFMQDIRGVVSLPHKFEAGKPLQVAVITDNVEEQKQAEELGASTVADNNFIKHVNQGMFDREDIRSTDYFLCTRPLSHSMSAIRNKLQTKTPSAKNGTVCGDIIESLKYFLSGVKFESRKFSQSHGSIRIPVGQLHMDIKDLEENFQAMYFQIANYKPINIGPYIESAKLVAPPSQEVFHVKVDGYFEQFVSHQKQKKEAAKQAVVEEEEEEEGDD